MISTSCWVTGFRFHLVAMNRSKARQWFILFVQRFMVVSIEWFVPCMTRSQRSTQMRWADSDIRIRRRRERPGLGWSFWWRVGSTVIGSCIQSTVLTDMKSVVQTLSQKHRCSVIRTCLGVQPTRAHTHDFVLTPRFHPSRSRPVGRTWWPLVMILCSLLHTLKIRSLCYWLLSPFSGASSFGYVSSGLCCYYASACCQWRVVLLIFVALSSPLVTAGWSVSIHRHPPFFCSPGPRRTKPLRICCASSTLTLRQGRRRP